MTTHPTPSKLTDIPIGTPFLIGHSKAEWGDKLSAACRYSEKNLYRGDDGLIYLD